MKNLIKFLITGYQKIVSPHMTPCCRFYPSCSEYMIQSLDKHGLVRGIGLGIRRLFRCNPFSRGGFDPVK